VLVEVPDPLGPWGARGMAEMPFMPLAPAVVAALHDATGVWFDVIRRRVALATAVLEGNVNSPQEALSLAPTGTIPVLISPQLQTSQFTIHNSQFTVIDARLAKRNIDTHIHQAPFVIALGPGFTAGVDCHAIIETMRGHTLGRVIWQGPALPNTGTPGVIGGKGAERVLRAPADGPVNWRLEIGDWVAEGDVIGEVAGLPVAAPFAGVIRGLIAPGTAVTHSLKIGDVDARADVDACFTISDKALAIGGGVLEAILVYLNQR
jgi:xanthine dehydrogenase accessory factor